jgi:Na+/H+-dicarboxylate symporter
MKEKKKLTLPAWIFIGMLAGIVAGLIFLALGLADFTTNYIKPFGTIYINLLKFLVVPVVITSIVSGVVSLGDVRRVGSIGWKTIVYYLLTTLVAIIIGLILANIFKGVFPVLETSGLEYEAKSSNVMDVIVNIFPSNMWGSFADANMLQVIVIALFLGVGILLAGDKAQGFDNFMTSAYEVVMKIMMMMSMATES